MPLDIQIGDIFGIFQEVCTLIGHIYGNYFFFVDQTLKSMLFSDSQKNFSHFQLKIQPMNILSNFHKSLKCISKFYSQFPLTSSTYHSHQAPFSTFHFPFTENDLQKSQNTRVQTKFWKIIQTAPPSVAALSNIDIKLHTQYAFSLLLFPFWCLLSVLLAPPPTRSKLLCRFTAGTHLYHLKNLFFFSVFLSFFVTSRRSTKHKNQIM